MSKFYRPCVGPARLRLTIIPALLALFGLACAVVPVYALDPPSTFDIKLDRSLAHLNHPNDPIANHSGAFIDAQNNRPFIQLTNLVDEPLTTFEMTVADAAFFHFAELPQGPANVLNPPPGVFVTPTISPDGNTLKLEFDAGLEKDQSVQFQIRFGADACPLCQPSYQVALFNICHDGVPMGSPGTLTTNNDEEPSTWIVNFPTQYVDGHDAPASLSSILNPPKTESAIDDQPSVPEPSGLVLAISSLCAMAQSCFARRRRAEV